MRREFDSHEVLPVAKSRDVTLLAFEITAALIVVLDRQGRVVRFNPACEQLTGLNEQDVQGQLLWPLVLDADEARRAETLYAMLTPDHAIGAYENYWMDRKGQRRYVRWQTTYVLSPSGDIDLVVATGIDVTDERRARLALEESEVLFRTLFSRSADGVVLIDPHDPETPWRIVNCNQRFAGMNGYQVHELIGKSIDVLHEDDLMARRGAEFLSWLQGMPDGAQGSGTHVHRDGRILQIESSSSLLRLGGQELILGIDRDVTVHHAQQAALQDANEEMSHRASHDELTGLLNRSGWLGRVGLQVDASGPRAVLFLDLDGFKAVNDALGHAAGDEVLREVGRRLRDMMRPTDVVGRLGGDEFVALVHLRAPEDVRVVAQRLEGAIRAPLEIAGRQVQVGVSIGSCPLNPGDTAEDGLHRADLAMYAVKGGRSGRQSVQRD